MSNIFPALRRLPGTLYSWCLHLEFLCPKCIWPDNDHLAFLNLEPQIWETTGNPCHGDYPWRGLKHLSFCSLQLTPPLVHYTFLKADTDFLESVKNPLIINSKTWLAQFFHRIYKKTIAEENYKYFCQFFLFNCILLPP